MASDPGFGGDALQLALRVIRILEDLGAPAWIGGSLASSMFGIPRSTQDADLVADLRGEMVRPFIERLGDDFYADRERIARGVERRSSFNLIHLPTMFKVDVFLLGRDPRSLRELERRQTVEIGEARVPIPVTSPEDVVVRKLAWYRDGGRVSDRQWRDALGVARVQGERLDLEYLSEAADEAEVADLLDELLAEAGLPRDG